MNEAECVTSIQRCPRFRKCDAPLCPLDPKLNVRVYLLGEPTCQLPHKQLKEILGSDFAKTWPRFTKTSLEKEARFKSLIKKNPYLRRASKNRTQSVSDS